MSGGPRAESRRAAATLLALGLAVLVAGPAEGHGFHTTHTEMTYRPERRVLEVSLLISEDDLLRAAAPPTGRPLDAEILKSWLEDRFRVESAEGPLPLVWFGREAERRGFWLHFEVREVDALAGKTLVHEVLQATEPFALHTVRMVVPGTPPRVRTLDRGRSRLDLGASRRAGSAPEVSRNVKDHQETSPD